MSVLSVLSSLSLPIKGVLPHRLIDRNLQQRCRNRLGESRKPQRNRELLLPFLPETPAVEAAAFSPFSVDFDEEEETLEITTMARSNIKQ